MGRARGRRWYNIVIMIIVTINTKLTKYPPLIPPTPQKTSLFQTMFWLLATVCLLCYGAIMPFNNMAQGYLLKYYLPIHVRICDI